MNELDKSYQEMDRLLTSLEEKVERLHEVLPEPALLTAEMYEMFNGYFLNEEGES